MTVRQLPNYGVKQRLRSSETNEDKHYSQLGQRNQSDEDAQMALDALQEDVYYLGRSIDALAEEKNKHKSEARCLGTTQMHETQRVRSLC